MVIDNSTGMQSGINVIPNKVSKVSDLPTCGSDADLGLQIYAEDMLKPDETAGQGSGGNAVCTTDGSGGYKWVSQFSGQLAKE